MNIPARIRSWSRVGAVAPSSHVLAERMARAVPQDARVIVELGAGTGSVTRALLKRVSADATVIAIEELSECVEALRAINDRRLIVVCGNATNLLLMVKQCGVDRVDCVVSGLPLSTLPKKEEHAILAAVQHILLSGGVFVQFQYFLASFGAVHHYFSNLRIFSWVLWNMPPAFVYRAVKE